LYLPYIRPIFWGYVRRYTPKIWPEKWYSSSLSKDPEIPIDVGVSIAMGVLPSSLEMVYFMENPKMKWMIWRYPPF
jgi:hypothetical protein